MTLPTLGRGTGTVAAFDEAAGIGTVVDTTGRELFFHCTEIADGTRTIAAGTTVAFALVAGRRGRWEAADLHTVGGGAPD
ncbi:MAG TPA: cold shock domain-containing protein [Acidimicrobiales bacterium]|nr:cold shock domain-containing protein [Acidimicrobiales bacterium]